MYTPSNPTSPTSHIFAMMNNLNVRALLVRDYLPAALDAERAIAKAAEAAGRGPRGLALNVCKSKVGDIVALLLCADERSEVADAATLIKPLVLLAMGWAKRAENEGAPVGSG